MIGWNAEEKANKNILKSAYKSQTKRLGFVHTSLNVQPETEQATEEESNGRYGWVMPTLGRVLPAAQQRTAPLSSVMGAKSTA